MTLIVNQLETFDKSNLEVIRLEFAKLQKKLEECQKDHDVIKPDIGKATIQLMVDNRSEKCWPLKYGDFLLFSVLYQIKHLWVSD